MIYTLGDRRPIVAEDCFVAPSAAVIGSVTLGPRASVWFGVVARGDQDNIVIGAGSNVQDNSVLHVDPGEPLTIGNNVTVGHMAMLHGCEIGDSSLIGIGAVVLNRAKIGRECLVGAKALVTEDMVVPDGSLVLGSPARIKRQLSVEERAELQRHAQHYIQNAQRFALELTEGRSAKG